MDNIVKADEVSNRSEFQQHFFPDFVFGTIDRDGKGTAGAHSPLMHTRLKTCPSPGSGDRAAPPYQEGFKKGAEDGYQDAIEGFKPVFNGLRQAVGDVEKLKHKLYSEAEKNVIALAMAVARKIVGCEIKTNPKMPGRVIAKTLKQIRDDHQIMIRMNPTDLKAMRDADVSFSKATKRFDNVQVESDRSVSRGGCIVESGSRVLDARIENQFQEMERLMTEINK